MVATPSTPSVLGEVAPAPLAPPARGTRLLARFPCDRARSTADPSRASGGSRVPSTPVADPSGGWTGVPNRRRARAREHEVSVLCAESATIPIRARSPVGSAIPVPRAPIERILRRRTPLAHSAPPWRSTMALDPHAQGAAGSASRPERNGGGGVLAHPRAEPIRCGLIPDQGDRPGAGPLRPPPRGPRPRPPQDRGRGPRVSGWGHRRTSATRLVSWIPWLAGDPGLLASPYGYTWPLAVATQ